jgi:Flp pilus assembly protein TadD
MELMIKQTLQQALTAHKAGQLEEAERHYRTVLQTYPTHPDVNHNLGLIVVSANKTEAALPLFETALEANPKKEQFWLSYLDALVKARQFEKVEQVLERAIAQGVPEKKLNAFKDIDTASAPEEQINTFLERYQAGHFSDAEKLAKLLTQEFPKDHFGWRALGAVLSQTGRHSEGIDACEIAIALRPQDSKVHNNLGVMRSELGRFEDAEASYKQAIALKPDYTEAHYNLGYTMVELGRLEEAEVSFRQAVVLKPDYMEAHNNLLTCLFLLNKKELFYDELDSLINQGVVNAVTGSFTCRSALKYGLERENLFCKEPLKYVSQIDLSAQYNFEDVFIRNAKAILNGDKGLTRKQSLLINGYQTSGNLFDRETASTEEIQKIIRLEVEKYRVNFQSSEDGLIKKWPTDYSIYGWLISMKSGGELKPHIHNQGWLSGSIYINIPSKVEPNSGNLVVSLGQEIDATDTRTNEKKIIDVATGELVLFPASLTHYTIPFEAEEERIVLAFDVR